MTYIQDSYNLLSNVSWSDYGFYQNDLTMVSMPLTLKALAYAIYERVFAFDVIGYPYSICASSQAAISNFKLMRPFNIGARNSWSSNDYVTNYQYLIDLCLREFGNLYLNSNGCYVDAISRNPQPLVLDNCMNEVVTELNNEGFICSLFPTQTQWSTGVRKWLTMNIDKNFPIQRKRTIEKYRYFYASYMEESLNTSGGTKIGMIYKIGSNLYNTVTEAVNNLSSENYIRFLNSGNRMPVLLQYRIYENKIEIYDFPEAFVINKNWLDGVMQSYPNITTPLVTFGFNHDLFLNFYKWHYIDLQNVITFENNDYYVINVSPTRDEIISVMQNDLSNGDDGGRTIRITYIYGAYLKHFYDGADFFKFLDIPQGA